VRDRVSHEHTTTVYLSFRCSNTR